jgi:hypothetical protein
MSIATARTAQSLTQGPGDDVHATLAAPVFVRTAAGLTQEADAMRIVHHDDRAMLIGKVTDFL